MLPKQHGLYGATDGNGATDGKLILVILFFLVHNCAHKIHCMTKQSIYFSNKRKNKKLQLGRLPL